MRIKLGVVMDPIATIHYEKDSTLAMLWEASRRKYQIHYMEVGDLSVQDGIAIGQARELKVFRNSKRWFQLGRQSEGPLHRFDVLLMRKDPPFNMSYIYSTYILELAEKMGTLIINKPSSLRDANEKFFTTWFPQCAPPSLVSRDRSALLHFLNKWKRIVVKPLDGMGGESVFQIQAGEPNANVILETVTHQYSIPVLAQKFLAASKQGDKRILLVDGEPIPYALLRVPRKGESRGNLARGAKGKGVKITKRDRWLCSQMGRELRRKGLVFTGIDVIGNYVTEINVTSPTCIREIDRIYRTNISKTLFESIESKLSM